VHARQRGAILIMCDDGSWSTAGLG
jgi:hypothetical protein